MANPTKFTAKEVLNKVLLDSSGNAVSANSVTSQEALSMALDATNNRLNVALEGGTISGDVTISGDLTVSGSNTYTYDEQIDGQLWLKDSGASASDAGGHLRLFSDDGAVMASGHRLGVIEFAGAEDTSSTITVGARIEALTDATWSASENGSSLLFYTTDGNASQSEVLKLDSSQNATFAGNNYLSNDKAIWMRNNAGNADTSAIFTNTSDELVLRTGGSTDSLKINTSGNATFAGDVGIGMTPVSRLSIKANGDTSTVLDIHGRSSDDFAIISFKENASQTVKGQIKVNGSDSMIFRTGASTDALTIDSSQRVGIGTASPNFPLEIVKTGGGDCQVGITTYDNDATDNTQLVLRTADGTEASPALVDDGDVLGDIRFAGHDGSNFKESAIIRAAVDGDWSTTSGDNPTKLEFYTQDNGSGSELGTSNMVIRQDGKVGINEPNPDKKLHISSATSTDGIMIEQTGTGASMVTFFADGAERGFMGVDDSDGGAFLSSTSGSDYIMCLRSEQEMHFGTGGNNTRFVLDDNSRISLGNNDSGGDTSNTIFGRLAGNAITSGGIRNVLIGEESGSLLTTGEQNVAIGRYALKQATTQADDNIAIGNSAMGGNLGTNAVTGCIMIGSSSGNSVLTSASSGSIGIGVSALNSLTSGAGNLAIGYQSADAITTGDFNTAIGYQALSTEDTGDRNTAVGYQSLLNVNGANNNANTALGYLAGTGITTGIKNTMVGAFAGYTSLLPDNCTLVGYNAGGSGVMTADADGTVAVGMNSLSSLTSGQANVAVGFEALNATSTGSYNTAVGYEALKTLPDGGDKNTAIGWKALHSATSSDCDNLTAIGYKAGFQISTGFNNTLIGANVDVNTGNFDNVTAIGNNFEATSSDSVFLGNADVTDVYMASDSGATVHCAGIQFPATQVANGGANVLDDYEEGFYTVTLTPSTSGSITVSSSYDTASYTKIGRQVTVTGAIDTSAISSPVGFIKVNVPFTIGANTELSHRASGSVVVYSASSNIQDYMVFADGGEANFRIYLSTGTTLATTSAATIDASTSIAFTFTYFV